MPPHLYSYIGIEESIKAAVRSGKVGPALLQYYQEHVDNLFNEETDQAPYLDFFCISLFRKAVVKLGGVAAVKNDIFLMLSTDGVQAFNSVEYSYWPLIVIISNLPPSEGFKLHNVLPLMPIPGPKAPFNLVSFPSLLERLSRRDGKDGKRDGCNNVG